MIKKLMLTAAFTSALFLFSACETQQTTIKVPENVNLPKKIKVIAQSCDSNAMYQTVIDLANNEIVILIYNEMTLISVIRTGITSDPEKQDSVRGKDAPDAVESARSRYGSGEGKNPYQY